MKKIFANCVSSIILRFLLCIFTLIIILGVIALIKADWIFSIILIIFYGPGLAVMTVFNTFLGYLKYNDKYIYIPNDLTFKRNRIQYKEIIYIKDIFAIEFVEEECNSIGATIPWRYTGIPEYLKIYMNDNSIKRIYISKYSFKIWKKLEMIIINNKSDVFVVRDAISFKNRGKSKNTR